MTISARKSLIVSFVFIIVSASMGFAGDTLREVVEKFCQLDYNGDRMISSTYNSIEPLISYPAEPGWDIVIGIIGYKIIDEKITDNSATIQVQYDIDRSWPVRIKDINKYSIVTFSLEMKECKWKISKYILYPRVSSKLLCEDYGYCDSGS